MRLILLTLSLLLSFQSFATPANITSYTLKNGLKIIVKPDNRAPVVVSMVWYKVGSADEPGGITGISHVLEHMMFKGTKTFGPGHFSKKIASIGGKENAFTNRDYTAYFEILRADQLAVSFELEADRMHNLKLLKEEFDKEIKVVREERRMRTDDNPHALTRERFAAAAHLAAPYQHPVVGWMNDLHQMTIQDLSIWYKRWYTPSNATLVVVGAVKPAAVLALAKRYFGPIPKGQVEARKIQREPRPLGTRQLTVHAPAKLPLLIMGYSVPSLKSSEKPWKAFALEVLVGILDGGESARLPNALIRNTSVASSADTYYDLYARFDNQLSFYAVPSKGHSIAELQSALLKEIGRLQATPVSSQELRRIKNQVIAAKVFQQDSLFGQAMEIGQLETAGLGFELGENYVSHIEAVTPKQIQAVAKEFLTAKRLTLATLKPTSGSKP